jgi:hypothetical protein
MLALGFGYCSRQIVDFSRLIGGDFLGFVFLSGCFGHCSIPVAVGFGEVWADRLAKIVGWADLV